MLALAIAGRRDTARAVAGFVPDCAVLFKRLAAEPRVARRQKVALVLLGAYLAMPLDLVPDFIPVAGQLDDAILVALVLRWIVRSNGLTWCACTGPDRPRRSGWCCAFAGLAAAPISS